MIDPKLLAAAKADMARLQMDELTRDMTPADRLLCMKYPKHTLAAARLIDSAPCCGSVPLPGQVMHEAGEDFQRLQWQESGMPYGRQ